MRQVLAAVLLLASAASLSAQATPSPAPPALPALAERLWQWRAANQPMSGDDIPRIERPADWVPDWSPAAVRARREALGRFEREWRAIDTTGWSRPAQVDYRLVGSALARVHWELDVTRGWKRNPLFYLEQTLGAVHERLTPPPPFDAARSTAIVRRVERIPQTLAEGRANLTEAVGPFAQLAVNALGDIRPRLEIVARELGPQLTGPDAARLPAAMAAAITALEEYRRWLEQRIPSLPTRTAIGREAYVEFLQKVALVPYTPEQLVAMARQDWQRAVAFEAYERERNRALPELPLFAGQDAQLEQEAAD